MSITNELGGAWLIGVGFIITGDDIEGFDVMFHWWSPLGGITLFVQVFLY